MNNTNISYFDNLKILAQEKIELEINNKKDSHEYRQVNYKINALMNRINNDDLRVIERCNNMEIKNYENFYNSDIKKAQYEHMNEKIQINHAISDIIKTTKQELSIFLGR